MKFLANRTKLVQTESYRRCCCTKCMDTKMQAEPNSRGQILVKFETLTCRQSLELGSAVAVCKFLVYFIVVGRPEIARATRDYM
jgi:hypothetical protein